MTTHFSKQRAPPNGRNLIGNSFYNQLDHLWAANYVPTDKDIIRCRAKTTGIAESIFHLGPLTYRMLDVGGQRSERKKWYAEDCVVDDRKRRSFSHIGSIASRMSQPFCLSWPSVAMTSVL